MLRRSVCGRLYGCGSRCLRSREDAGCRVGLTALPGAAMWRGLVPLRQRGNGSFRLSAAPAPWSAATILRNGMPTAWLYHKAGQMLHHNAISLPVCRCTFPPKKKAATLSLNASAQNIPTLVGKSIMLRDVHIYLQYLKMIYLWLPPK